MASWREMLRALDDAEVTVISSEPWRRNLKHVVIIYDCWVSHGRPARFTINATKAPPRKVFWNRCRFCWREFCALSAQRHVCDDCFTPCRTSPDAGVVSTRRPESLYSLPTLEEASAQLDAYDETAFEVSKYLPPPEPPSEWETLLPVFHFTWLGRTI